MNSKDFYEMLREELIEELGNEICQADWDALHDEIKWTNEQAAKSAASIVKNEDEDDREFVIGLEAERLSKMLHASRADLPSIRKYIYAKIEESI